MGNQARSQKWRITMRKSIDQSKILVCGIILACVTAFACASTDEGTPIPENSPLAGAPDWVLKGCSAYWGDDGGARICGVGSMGGTRNISLARTAAIGRARTEIARSLQVKVKAMLKDYQATTTGGEEFGTAAADEQHIEDVSKQITEMTLNGTTLQDTWVGPDGTLYTLVALDVESFEDSISQMSNLSETIRKAVQERAKASFEELDEATQ
jgi:hypothetical protein